MKKRRKRISQLLDHKPGLKKLSPLLIHFIPAVDISINFEPTGELEDLKKFIKPTGASGWDARHNFDGYKIFSNSYTGVEQYVQLFRNGAIEFFYSELVVKEVNGKATVSGNYLNTVIADAFQMSRFFFETYHIKPPYYFYLTLLGFKETTLIIAQGRLRPSSLETDDLFFPKLHIDELYEEVFKEKISKILNHVWQSWGFSENKLKES